MKVIYKKSIVEKMDEAIHVAEYEYPKKEIEKFILTREEYNELCRNLKPFAFYTITGGVTNTTSYRGVPIEIGD